MFELQPYHDGFLLRYPTRRTTRSPPSGRSLLYAIAEEYRERARISGVSSVGALNSRNSPKRIKEYIQVRRPCRTKNGRAGGPGRGARGHGQGPPHRRPSSSGKTTTFQKTGHPIEGDGIRARRHKPGRYFVDREHTPRDENGDYDFECLEALDKEYLTTSCGAFRGTR